MTYKDKHGYKREYSNAIHRHRAYHYIYLKDRKKYPLPFEAYEVHHIDGNKNNNKMDNLAILTPEEHDKAHEPEEMEKVKNSIYFKKLENNRAIYKKEKGEIREAYKSYIKKVMEQKIYLIIISLIWIIVSFYVFPKIFDSLNYLGSYFFIFIYIPLTIIFFIFVVKKIFNVISLIIISEQRIKLGNRIRQDKLFS